MKVFSKYLVKSITEKKGRTLLLLMSIAVSAALLVASLGSIKALLGTLSAQIKGNLGEYNVVLSPGKSLEVPLFKPVPVEGTDMDKSFKGISIGGYLSNDSEREFNLTGTALTDFNNLSSMQILKKDELEPFAGKKLIISQKTSDSLKVKPGDELKLNILGKEEMYKIAAIATNKGMFFEDKEKRFTLITPEENVFSIYGEKDKYSMQLVSVNSSDLNGWIKNFNDSNRDNKIVASKVYDEQAMEQQLAMIKMPLLFMLCVVLLMTTFIIYSSFKLIITERLPVIGTFLSQGATKGSIMRILLRESAVYGIVGGILGDILGAVLTALVAYYGNPLKEYGIKATTDLYIPYFAAGFVFAIVLSIASTALPILSIRKLPVKDVILNTISTANNITLKGFITGVILIICSVLLHVTGAKTGNAGSIPGIFLGFAGVILVIPKLVDIVCYPVVRLLRNLNGLSMLSFNNVRTSRVLINNLRLIAVSVISIVMISSLRVSIVEVVKGAYDGMKMDVFINVNSNYLKNINDIVTGYEDASLINGSGNITANLNGDPSKLMNVAYVDPQKYKTLENYTVFDNKEEELDALDKDEDGIIISRQMAVRYKIKQGDTITLTTGEKNEQFKVLSIYNAKMMNSGNYNLISMKAANRHFDIKYPTQYYITTRVSAADGKAALEKKLKGLGVTMMTKTEMNKSNDESNKQLTDILGIFSYITMIIGAFGILSNVSISYLQRKREIAVMSSVGLTTAGRGVMLLLESVFQALIGCIVSLAAAYGINICLTDIFKFLTLDLQLRYPFESIAIIGAATLILMLATSMSSILKSRKLQIVQELKYE